MEKERVPGYVAGLEQVLKNNHLALRETMTEFHEMVQMVTPERSFPKSLIGDIRKAYRDIQDQLTRIKAIQQLLQAKYRAYYHRDPTRDREIMEFGFLAKNSLNKFEFALKEIEVKRARREQERLYRIYSHEVPFSWFRSQENQFVLLKNLRKINRLGYESPTHFEAKERRQIAETDLRSLSLFVFSGQEFFLDDLQSRITVRSHDIQERYGDEEFRGALTHLREISGPEVEQILRRLAGSERVSKLKCLIFPIRSPKDFGKEIFGVIERTIEEIGEGEMRTLSS
jgi:hypothetical protein